MEFKKPRVSPKRTPRGLQEGSERPPGELQEGSKEAQEASKQQKGRQKENELPERALEKHKVGSPGRLCVSNFVSRTTVDDIFELSWNAKEINAKMQCSRRFGLPERHFSAPTGFKNQANPSRVLYFLYI